ncbi:MAG: hypothetical protein E6G21_12740, partial [Actinobacteria bacterium]
DYLKSPSPETVLALVGAGIRKDATLAKAVAKIGELLVYDLPKRGTRADLPGWVRRQFAALGLKVDAAAASLLVDLVGDDLDELAGEVEKLAAWANGQPVGEREVELLVAPRGEIPPFAMTDAWGRRDVAGVLEASERLLARAGGPARDSLPRIVGLMTSHVARVAECRSLAADGVTPRRRAAGCNRPARGARPRAQGRQPARGRARVQPGTRRPDPAPRGRACGLTPGYEPLSRRAACAFLRAAVFR